MLALGATLASTALSRAMPRLLTTWDGVARVVPFQVRHVMEEEAKATGL